VGRVVTDTLPTATTDQGVDLVRVYRDMVRCRAFEDTFRRLVDSGETIVGWHPCVGAESLCAIYSQLRQDDWCGYTHRIFYPWLCKGVAPAALYAEACGRVGGTSKGKGGTHIASPAHGILGRSGMQGGHFSLFAGTAWASQVTGDGRVSVVTAGDGCSTSGGLHEAANFAAVWKLPLIFVCDNNQCSQSVTLDQTWAQPDVSRIAAAYGMPAVIVDGGDPVGVAEAGRVAILRARTGGGPTFIEVKLVRWGPHYLQEPDGLAYRDAAAIERSQAEGDPVVNLGAVLVSSGQATEDQLAALQQDAVAEMRGAAGEALDSPEPPTSEAFTDLFID
jgi:TPP-dependent pyruvate/acetoin dehydrogenase alpha subunit